MSGSTVCDGSIRVFVVDDHPVVRRGLASFLNMLDDIRVVGQAGGGDPAVRRIAELVARDDRPDVVLMDLLMPDVDGAAVTATLKRDYPDMEVVALTSFGDTARVSEALQAGAAGYLLKTAEADEVAVAIRAAYRGQVHLDPTIAGKLTHLLVAPEVSAAALTSREREVLRLVAKGMSNREIASNLVISERTARTHVSNVLAKLDLASRTQAALWAVREGIA